MSLPNPLSSSSSGQMVGHGAGGDRYKNLRAVSASIRIYGGIIKIVGLVVGALGVIGCVVGLASGQPFGVGLAVVVIFFGVVLHVMGTVIAAMGEGLLALSDIATNTAPK